MQKITANTYFLFIDPAKGTDYSNIMCLVNFNFSGTTGTNDASSMCGADITAGDITATIPFTAQMITDPQTGEISAPDIFNLWQNRDDFSWKIGRAVPQPTDFTKAGDGFLSAYGENYDLNAVGQFSGTISVKGAISQTITPSDTVWQYDNNVGVGGLFKIVVNGAEKVNTSVSNFSQPLVLADGDIVQVTVESTSTGTADIQISGAYSNGGVSDIHTVSDGFTYVLGAGGYFIYGTSSL